ncbi:hypothetical protein HAX54_001977 [Datura stramonium]|uniref:Uncharacterized protein n=1 Tax=Datura stramonium TaxID=4076 RepID=A0ABS8T357_DATST|nr:hypothetical protein [Datura stramonium]
MDGMAELVEMVTFQGWRHLFVPPVPTLHEAEVREFYHELTFADNGTKLLSKLLVMMVVIVAGNDGGDSCDDER